MTVVGEHPSKKKSPEGCISDRRKENCRGFIFAVSARELIHHPAARLSPVEVARRYRRLSPRLLSG